MNPYIAIVIVCIFAVYVIRILQKTLHDQRVYGDQRAEDNKELIAGLRSDNEGLLNRCLARNGFAPLGAEKIKEQRTPPQPTGLPPQMQAKVNAKNNFNQWKVANGKADPRPQSESEAQEELERIIQESEANSTVVKVNS